MIFCASQSKHILEAHCNNLGNLCYSWKELLMYFLSVMGSDVVQSFNKI